MSHFTQPNMWPDISVGSADGQHGKVLGYSESNTTSLYNEQTSEELSYIDLRIGEDLTTQIEI